MPEPESAGTSTEITVEVDVPATMRDGTVLRSTVWRPAGAARRPVLLSRLPYGKDMPAATLVLDPLAAVRRGYAVILQDTRGRFASDGEFRPFEETDDSVDTVAWAATLPFSDGRVGMFGASYLGFTQWVAAAGGAAALQAIAPYMTCADPLNGLYFRGGAFELGIQTMWYLGSVAPDLLVRRHGRDGTELRRAFDSLAAELDGLASGGFAALPLAEFAPVRRLGLGQAFFDPLRRPMDAAAFDYMTIQDKYHRVRTPAFNIGGWFDIFCGQTLDNYLGLRARGVPTKLLIGPWAHSVTTNPVGEIDFGMLAQSSHIEGTTDLTRLQLRWFDRWLTGTRNGMDREPPVKLFVMGVNRWRDEDDWPLRRAVPTAYYLHAGGRLAPEPPEPGEPDGYDYDPADPVPSRGGPTMLPPELRPGPYDQRPVEARPDVLTFTTAPLAADLEVTGPLVVHLWAASSAPDTDFVARLCDVHPDGRSMNLADGIVRARYRAGPAVAPSLIEPGKPYEFVLDLWATSNVFRAGHCLRLDVTSSSFPRWDRNPNTGAALFSDTRTRVARQRILHDPAHPSRIVLPVVLR